MNCTRSIHVSATEQSQYSVRDQHMEKGVPESERERLGSSSSEVRGSQSLV